VAAGDTDPELARLDPRDRQYAESLEEGERDVVVSTVARYRRPETLRVGDPLPELAAVSLDGGDRVALRDLAREQPLLLVFGSFT
jgi:hypothetical protein